MKIPYCTCAKQSKELFTNGFVLFGIVWHALVLVAVVVLFSAETFVPLFLLATIVWSWWAWDRFEYRRQALFLGHSQACANRYATRAAFAVFRGYDPRYSKLIGYTSALKTMVERILGKKKARKAFRSTTVLGGIGMVLLIGLMTYDGLTRQRNGLPNYGAKYDPGVTESTWAAIGLATLAVVGYAYLQKRIKHKALLISVVTAGSLGIWLGITYAVAWYARLSFWETAGTAILIIVVVAVFCAVLLLFEKIHNKRKRKERQRLYRQRKRKSATSL